MKKIAVLYPAFFEQSNGGAELQIYYFVRAALDAGFTIHYIYEEKGKPIKNELGIHLHPLKKKADIRFCGKCWFKYRKEIYCVLNTIRPDIIYTRLGSSWIDIASVYASEMKIKHIHALASDKDVRRSILPGLFPLMQPLENFYINRGLKNCSLILVQNAYQQEKITKKYGKETVMVPQMTPYLDNNTIVKEREPMRILWVANFKKIKRPELFVRLAKELKMYAPIIKMEMYGRMSKKYTYILKEIDEIENLFYMGEVLTEQMLNIMSHSHILVNTSEYEGFSNTFVQAWMRKVPVFSMSSNPNNVFSNYNVGAYTPSFEALVNSISELISNRKKLDAMAEDAYYYAISHHSLEKIMPNILDIL